MSDSLLDSAHAGAAAVRGGLLRVGGYGFGVIVTVLSGVVLFRHLGVDDAGRYVLVLSIVTLAAGITDVGLSSIGVRELALREGGDRERFMRNLLGLRVAFTITGMGLACAYAALAGLGGRLVLGTAIAGVGILAQNLQSTYATALMADLRLGWVTAIDVVRQVLTALAIVGLAVAGATLLPFYAIAPLAGAVAVGLTAWRVRRSVPLLPALHVAEWRSLLVQTLPFALATAVTAVYFRLGILVVNQLSNAHQTGLFGASFRIIEVLIIVPQMMVGAVLPIFARAARDDHDRLAYGLGLVVQVSLIAGILVAGGFVIAAPVVIDIVAGPGFSGAVPVLRLHAVALFFSFAGAPYSYALLSLHHHRSILLASATGLVTMIVALVVLVPSHGAEGAAIGMVIGEAVLWLTGLMLVRRSGLDVRVTRPWRLAAAAAVAAIPGILLGPIAGAVVALPLFAGLVLALGAVPRELLDALPARLRSIP